MNNERASSSYIYISYKALTHYPQPDKGWPRQQNSMQPAGVFHLKQCGVTQGMSHSKHSPYLKKIIGKSSRAVHEKTLNGGLESATNAIGDQTPNRPGDRVIEWSRGAFRLHFIAPLVRTATQVGKALAFTALRNHSKDQAADPSYVNSRT